MGHRADWWVGDPSPEALRPRDSLPGPPALPLRTLSIMAGTGPVQGPPVGQPAVCSAVCPPGQAPHPQGVLSYRCGWRTGQPQLWTGPQGRGASAFWYSRCWASRWTRHSSSPTGTGGRWERGRWSMQVGATSPVPRPHTPEAEADLAHPSCRCLLPAGGVLGAVQRACPLPPARGPALEPEAGTQRETRDLGAAPAAGLGLSLASR